VRKFFGLFIALFADAPSGRRGYFAPRSAPGSAQGEQEELTNAMYSCDELNPSRLSVTTRFFKPGPSAQTGMLSSANDTFEIPY
jgi:hypothetical protein